MSTYVSLKLPSYFADIEIMKKNSYPFSHAFTRLLKALKAAQEETSMPFYLLLGRLEAASGQDFFGPENGDSIRFVYTERDPDACQFLKSNAEENGESVKNIVLRILQMCLRLRMGGYPSFDAIANLVLFGVPSFRQAGSSLPIQNTQAVRPSIKRIAKRSSSRSGKSSKKTPSTLGRQSKLKSKAQEPERAAMPGDADHENNREEKSSVKASQSSKTSESDQASKASSTVSKHPGITIKKGSGKKESKPEISDSTRQLLAKSKAKREELEKRAKEQENMKEKLEGVTVETNSLLSSFLR